ncbi:hypothetical protein PG994_004254 [Apiospora phragmitis]|uniref:Uncharacterized protein n=1 Tax=Apiospora phragmitis TaxID=2905665 RepID=A0ABR1VT61_9PEZI
MSSQSVTVPAAVVVVIGQGNVRLDLEPKVQRRAFTSAFIERVQAVKSEIDRLLGLEKRFAVVFCRGSFINDEVRKEIKDYMEMHVKSEAACKTCKVTYDFLSEYNETWSSRDIANCSVAVTLPSRPTIRPTATLDSLLGGSCFEIVDN